MPGLLLHLGAQVKCSHSGTAAPTTVNTRVKVGNQATVLLPVPYSIAGCALPSSAGGPCATAQWTTGTTRVKSTGQFLLFQSGQATCAPTGTPLLVVTTQARVKAV